MNMSKIESIVQIYNKLDDNESRDIFAARLEYIFDRNYEKLVQKLWDTAKNRTQKSTYLESFLHNRDKNKIIMMGGGLYGKRGKEILAGEGIEVRYYCDNDTNKVGTVIDGIRVLSVSEVCQNYRDHIIILTSPRHRKEMFDQLINEFFPQENIFYPRGGEIYVEYGKQYFDFKKIRPQKNDIFVDAGAYDGNTVRDFIKWGGEKNYKKIYSFEPDPFNYRNVVNNLSSYDNIFLENKGTWNESGKLFFDNRGPASRIISNDIASSIEVTTIDSVVKDDKVTFIKMDVEGAEKQTIEGAKKTIVNNKPSLAVCIYHTWLDFIDIPEVILKIMPEYKLAIRHYSSNTNETVLYAWVE